MHTDTVRAISLLPQLHVPRDGVDAIRSGARSRLVVHLLVSVGMHNSFSNNVMSTSIIVH